MKKIFLALFAISLISSCAVFKKQPKESYKVLLETTQGNITLQLYKDVPLHSDNFLKLVKEGFYDGLLFHRVIPQFMIQSGDPTSRNASANSQLGNGDVGYTIPAEFKIEKYAHIRGSLAAARTPNPAKASSGCQFYIVEGKIPSELDLYNTELNKGFKYTPEQKAAYAKYGGTPHLDNDYTVYGQVIDGLDVVTKISKVECVPGDRPKVDVKIIKARVIK